MMSRREPTSERDDEPLHIVGHRLQQVEADARGERAANMDAARGSTTPGGAPRSAHGARSARMRSTALRQVVLVDRDIDALRDVALALRDEFDFHITISGTEALNLLRAGGIDTIVVGQTLYSSTGLMVLAEARRLAPNTQRVLLANAVEASAIERGATAVAPFKVLQRPCTADKLRDLLEEAAAESAPMPKPVRAQTPMRLAETHNPADFEHVILETRPEPPRAGKGARREMSADAAALPVVVYTDNAEFYQAIAMALQDRHEVRLCTQLERAAEFAEQGQCPLLITDRAATQVELQRISIALRALDAGVITIASGPPEAGTALRKLLGTGALHSFLPKPINAPLVRLSVESAKRQYLDAKSLQDAEPEVKANVGERAVKAAGHAYFVPNYRADYKVDDFSSDTWRHYGPRIAWSAGLVVALAAAAWFGWQYLNPSAGTSTQGALAAAQQAFEAGRYTAADNSGALRLYADVLRSDPQNSAAQAGLDRTVDRVLEAAERALLTEQLDVAAAHIEAVRAVDPNNNRLPFLAEQLRRDRAALAAVAPKRVAPAMELRAPTEPEVLPARPIAGQSQRLQNVSTWLTTARQRMAQDRLTSPPEDNAEYYFRQAERADPDNQSVQQGLRELGTRLVNNARSAVERQQLEAARRSLADAVRLGAPASATDQIQRDIDAAVNAQARAGFLRLALQRTRDNRLFEPERDSAKFYLGQLERLDPSAAETQQAAQALAMRLIDNAGQAIDQKQLNAAAQLLNETRRLGYTGPELAAAESRLRLARNPALPPPSTPAVAAQPPRPIKTVAPRFPEDAMRAGIEGWVDVSFRITPEGRVIDVVALASSPGRYAPQFERAAVAALSQYQYPPSDSQTPRAVVQKVQFRLSR